MFEDLAGQVAVITGGARGLGFSMAQALARWGTKIALLDVLAEVKDSAATVQHEFAVKSVGVLQTSPMTAASPRRLVKSVARSVRQAFLSTPPGSPSGKTASMSQGILAAGIDINLTGTFLCCQALARACTAADTEASSSTCRPCRREL